MYQKTIFRKFLHPNEQKGDMKMMTNITQRKRQTGLPYGRTILVAILILLLMQGAAQAWWLTYSLFIVWRGGW